MLYAIHEEFTSMDKWVFHGCAQVLVEALHPYQYSQRTFIILTVYYVKVHEFDTIHEYLRLSMDNIGYCLIGRCSGDT